MIDSSRTLRWFYKSVSVTEARRIVLAGLKNNMEAATREGVMRGIRFTEKLPPYEGPNPAALIAVQVAQGLVDGYDIADAPEAPGEREVVLPATLLNFGMPEVIFALNGAAKAHKTNKRGFWARRSDGARTVSYKIIQSGDDVYITPRGQSMFKVSLHESGVQQESHLEPFWGKVTDGGSRHLERWTRPDGQPGQQVQLFKVVLPAREMVPLKPLQGENTAEFIELSCSSDDDVVEVALCYVQHGTAGVRRALHGAGITVLAEWPYLDGMLVVLSEVGKIKACEIALIEEAAKGDGMGYTEGTRDAASAARRSFLSLKDSNDVRGWMETRDRRANPPPPNTFKR